MEGEVSDKEQSVHQPNMHTTLAPIRAAITAWFAPLPPNPKLVQEVDGNPLD